MLNFLLQKSHMHIMHKNAQPSNCPSGQIGLSTGCALGLFALFLQGYNTLTEFFNFLCSRFYATKLL
jgi:hypothetical protein